MRILLIVISALMLFNSCSKDPEKIYDFVVPMNKIVLTDNRDQTIYFTNGSGYRNLEVTNISDNKILIAKIEPDDKFGAILLTPTNHGKCTITLTDKHLQQTQQIEVQVVNSYVNFHLNLRIPRVTMEPKEASETDETNKIKELLSEIESPFSNRILTLVRNESKSFYLFSDQEMLAKGEYILTGNYAVENFAPPTRMTINKDPIGHYDETALAEVQHSILDLHYTYNQEEQHTKYITFEVGDALLRFLVAPTSTAVTGEYPSKQADTKLRRPDLPEYVYLWEDYTKLFNVEFPALKIALISTPATPELPTIANLPPELLK